ncbi:MAG: methyltransferase domain-containing protein [Candidatus Yanofskybacteria bacterium]|nr:methyltransferase domain-containing protein [Candidatus Yanofskybacteria bacterium]
MSELPQENLKTHVSIKGEEKKDLTWEERIPLRKDYAERFNLSEEEAEALDYYLFYLGLDVNDLVGKKVLDVGSGHGNFKKALQKIVEIKDGEFVNFDVNIFAAELGETEQELDVSGAAETLPFKDESFDFVLANFSVPVMQFTGQELELIPKTLREMVRVVRGGGVIKIFPVGGEISTGSISYDNAYSQLLSIVMTELKKISLEKLLAEIKITKFSKEEGLYEVALQITKK